MVKQFEVIEDNAGGLMLAVFAEDGTVEYLHYGYQSNEEQLAADIKALKEGDDPVNDWEGNEENPQLIYDSITSEPRSCWNVVADNEGVYADYLDIWEGVFMEKWCIVDIRKDGDNFLDARESKEEAIKRADSFWSNLDDADKENKEAFLVGLCRVGRYGDYYVDENGNIDTNIYEIAKEYKHTPCNNMHNDMTI